MKFGVGIRNKKSGADIYVIVFQVCSLLPALYTLIASGYMALFVTTNVFTYAFDFGMAALPRWETLLLSVLYRYTSHEVAVHMALLAVAFAFGIAAGRLLRAGSKAAAASRKVFLVLIGADLVFRLLPFYFNVAFGWPAAIFGFVVRAVCFVLVLLDLRASAEQRDPRDPVQAN